jgi:sirohydrochlorin ferrochelatase
MTAALVGVAHGSRDPAAQRTVEALLDEVRARRPDLDVRAAYVQNAAPDVEAALARAGTGAVVVPLLLSRGYHVAVDIGRAAAAAGAAVASPLGPDPALAAALDERLAETGTPSTAPIVLAAAGSSDPDAVADVEAQARLLAQRRGTPVVPAYATAQSPTVHDAVTRLLAEHAGPVAVAPYLLAPGHFADVIAGTAATWVARPIGVHPAIVDLVIERYEAA